MESKERALSHYAFRGNASGAGGTLTEVKDQSVGKIIPTYAASSLPVTGGRSRSEYPGYKYSANGLEIFRSGPITTHAETMENSAGDSITSVSAEAFDVWVYPSFEIPYLRSHLQAQSTTVEGMANIRLGNCVLNEIRLGSNVVKVELDLKTFSECDSFEEAIKGASAHRRSATGAPSTGGSKGVIVSDIVAKLIPPEKAGDEITVSDNRIYWKNFGWIVVGEILISRQYRRLTMIRLELGSPIKGSIGIGETESDGHWVP